MAEVAFDTNAEIRKLQQAGCPGNQAEAIVDLVSRAPLNVQMVKDLERVKLQTSAIETSMATKTDIVQLRGEVTTLRAETRADILTLRAETKADIASLRADMFRALWIQGGILAALILSLAGLMLRSAA